MAQVPGQTELMPPEATRVVRTRPGRTAHWGVDPSTKRVAIATISAEGLREVHVEVFPKLDGAQRLAGIYATTYRLVHELLWSSEPGYVLIERPAAPAGRPVNMPMVFAVGVIQGAIAAALGPEVRIEEAMPSEWKRRTLGNGGIRKPKPGDREPYAVLSWAQVHGYAGTDWDAADAMAIAEAGRRDVRLEEIETVG